MDPARSVDLNYGGFYDYLYSRKGQGWETSPAVVRVFYEIQNSCDTGYFCLLCLRLRILAFRAYEFGGMP